MRIQCGKFLAFVLGALSLSTAVLACPQNKEWLVYVRDNLDPSYFRAYLPGQSFELPGLRTQCVSKHENFKYSRVKDSPNLNDSCLEVACGNVDGDKMIWTSTFTTELDPSKPIYSETEKAKWRRQPEWFSDRDDNQYILFRDKEEKHSYRVDVRCVDPERKRIALQHNK